MKSKDTSNLISGIFIMCISGLGLFLGRDLPARAAGFPIFLLICLALLGSLFIINAFYKEEKGEKSFIEFDIGVEEKDVKVEGAQRIIIIILLIIAGYTASMEFLGFFISTCLFFFVVLIVLGMRQYIVMTLISLLTSCTTFFVFRTVMYVSLPSGIFDPTELIYRYIIR